MNSFGLTLDMISSGLDKHSIIKTIHDTGTGPIIAKFQTAIPRDYGL